MLATGAALKNTFCLAAGTHAFLGRTSATSKISDLRLTTAG